MLVAALGIHTLFEGIAIGLVQTVDMLATLCMAVIIHEVCCSVALGVNISQQNLSVRASSAICFVFSLMMPVGIVIGIGLGEVQGTTGMMLAATMQGLATGTFIYVLFIEILPSSMDAKNSLLQMVFVFLGALSMTLIIIFTHKHEHSISTNSNGTSLAATLHATTSTP